MDKTKEKYQFLMNITAECNKLLDGRLSLVPHQIKCVPHWEVKAPFRIIQDIIKLLNGEAVQ